MVLASLLTTVIVNNCEAYSKRVPSTFTKQHLHWLILLCRYLVCVGIMTVELLLLVNRSSIQKMTLEIAGGGGRALLSLRCLSMPFGSDGG